jgi:4-hydroxy-tetrahydrodipicolinate synthase
MSPDLDAIQSNTQWLIDQGARVGNTILLAAGSGGDFSSMSVAERKAVITAVADVARDKVPVVAGVQSTNVRDTIALCQCCESLGIDAVQISNAYYYDGKPGDALAWMKLVARHCNIAFALYNNWYTGYNMPIHLIEEMLDTIPHAAAVKWSTPDAYTYIEGLQRFVPKAVVADNQFLPMTSWVYGCHVFISHAPNFYPQTTWRVLHYLEEGKYLEAKREWHRFTDPWLKVTGPVGERTAGEGVFVRPMMEVVGLRGGPSPLPSRDEVLTPEMRESYRSLWKQMQEYEAGEAG